METNIFIAYITFGAIFMILFGAFFDRINPRYQRMATVVAIGVFEIGLIALAAALILRIAKV